MVKAPWIAMATFLLALGLGCGQQAKAPTPGPALAPSQPLENAVPSSTAPAVTLLSPNTAVSTTPSPEPTAVPIPTPTSTPAPTQSPIPASTSIPTVTAEPTAEAVPATPTPISQLRTRFIWAGDGTNGDEEKALNALSRLANKGQSLGQTIAGYPWVADDISEDERYALEYIEDLHKRDASLGETIASLPWFQDDITEHERWALRYIKDVHQEDSSLGVTLAEMPWFQDDITLAERKALQNLSVLVQRDVVLADRVAPYPWVADDIKTPEWNSLGLLGNLLDQNPTLAANLAVMPFFAESIEQHDPDTLRSILNLKENHPNVLARLREQDWYQDGMDDQEAALVMIVGTPAGQVLAPEDLRGFFVEHYAESRTVTMPLAGEIKLTFIQSKPDQKNIGIVDQVEAAIRVIEEFMGVPFPDSEVVLLFAAPGELDLDTTILGLNRGTHMIIDPTLARQGDNNRVLNHETAHYYWGYSNAPLWFAEGGADFLSSYVREQLYDDSFDDRLVYLEISELRYCNSMGMGTIQKLVDDLESQGLAKHQLMPYGHCNYSEGENFFIRLFKTIGTDALSAAWRDIYLISGTAGRPANETEIYQAFLRNTLEENIFALREVYAEFHGGYFPE